MIVFFSLQGYSLSTCYNFSYYFNSEIHHKFRRTCTTNTRLKGLHTSVPKQNINTSKSTPSFFLENKPYPVICHNSLIIPFNNCGCIITQYNLGVFFFACFTFIYIYSLTLFTKHFVFSMGSSSSFYCDIIFCYHNLCTHVLSGIGYTQFFTIIKSAILGALIHTFWCSHANISLGYKPRLYC